MRTTTLAPSRTSRARSRFAAGAFLTAALAACSSQVDAPSDTATASSPIVVGTTPRFASIHPRVTDSACNGDLTNPSSNTVMHDARVHLIYWLPPGAHFEDGGDDTSDKRYEKLMERFFGDVSSMPLFSVLSQYTDSTGASPRSVTFSGSYLYTTAYPSGRGSQANPLQDSDIRDVISTVLGTTTMGWGTSTDDIYFVYTAAGVQSCAGTYECSFPTTKPDGTAGIQYYGYHNYYSRNGAKVIYSLMTSAASMGTSFETVYPNDPKADPTVVGSSHELFESLTDPLIDAWFTRGKDCGEIGDKCEGAGNIGSAVNFDGSNVVLPNGHRYVVQTEWSNALADAAKDQTDATRGCTLGIAPPPAPDCTPSYECGREFFQAYGGTPAGTRNIETTKVTCALQPTLVQEKDASGNWDTLGAYVQNETYPTPVPNQYEIGQQSDSGQTTVGDPVGAWRQIRGCIITNGGTTCDTTPRFIQVQSCCTPNTVCGERCGAITDGCGHPLDCGQCVVKTCTDRACCDQEGGLWQSTTNTCCTTLRCQCSASGGEWVGGKCKIE